VVVVALFLATRLVSWADIESARPGVDVQHYRFAISLNDTSNVLVGQADVTVRFIASVDSFFLDLVSATGTTGMQVSRVTTGAQAAEYRHAADRLYIKRPAQGRDSIETYRVEYRGVPRDGLIISTNKFGERTFFGDNWPNRARHWLPTVDHPTDKAMVDWVVTAPDHYRVIANGEWVADSPFSSSTPGYLTSHWRTHAPIPTKIMVIGVARFKVQDVSTALDIPIQNWLYPQDFERGVIDFAGAPPMLHYFVRQIGEFPYTKLANVQSTTRYGGMENAGAIFYNEQSITGRNLLESTVAHEIAHQWFGDSVTEGDWHHVWLSEGFANYFANLYWEEAYGRERMEARLQAERRAVLNYNRAFPDEPLVDLTITDPLDLLNVNAYQKGSWVLHLLRNEIGIQNFRLGIRQFYGRFRDGNAVTEDLQSVMEDVSGRDLGYFFQQWVYQSGQPVVSGSWETPDDTNKLTLVLRQDQEEPFSFPLDVALTTVDGDTIVRTVRMDGSEHRFDLEVDQEVRHVELDPNTNLLFINKFGD
jgi:aminopeptidase N